MDDIAADLSAAAWSAAPLDDDAYAGEPAPVDQDLDEIPGPVWDDPFTGPDDTGGGGMVDLSVIDLSALHPDLTDPPADPRPGGPEPKPEAAEGAALGAEPAPVAPPQPQSAPEPEPAVVDGAGADGVYGDPVEWSANWFYQQIDGYCGPSSAAQVIAQYTGVVIDGPQQLVDRALELGLMQDGDPAQGMTLPNLEVLLEDQGVPCTVTESSLDELQDKLEGGYAVIAMVDSGEIWHPDQETGEDDTADHFLVVAGIDADRGVVILSDPGAPSGNQLEVPIEQFEDAWADSQCQMLVADAPDPDLAERPQPVGTAAAVPTVRPWAMIAL